MNVTKFIRSFGYAFAGIRSSFSEQNFRSHCLSAIVVIIAAWWTGFTLIEWCVLLLVIGVMLALEMLNTAIERVVDLASPDVHPLAKQAKDIAAGAVLVFACISALIGALLFLPKWL
ncbi:MAG TPA: diacylglycerol kinase family protein [Metalysinibacillus jejuensis]|uniref:Diacylglycerol kinase family protein n=1 Tax=Metalysinibacillus jejuensis TaxID=914327 RepID=A0A921T5H2_9BACL|nr:diacylglycerol kinase family protein [Metalysinibacillus jejuensis]HJH11451.1 diacylglycerol kinase family protein [Metalysinibacillus jejuensis]